MRECLLDSRQNSQNRSVANVVIQRKVMGAKGAYYTDYDPWKTFGTLAEAKDHQKQLRDNGHTKRYPIRVPTIYTYTHTRGSRKISSVPQGPHTFAHRAIVKSVRNIPESQLAFNAAFRKVLTPKKVKDIIDRETPPNGWGADMAARLIRYANDYSTDYFEAKRLNILKNKSNDQFLELRFLINKLRNMNPFQTYSWKTSKAASKSSLKIKSENKPNPVFNDLFDSPKTPFKDQLNYTSFQNDAQMDFNKNF